MTYCEWEDEFRNYKGHDYRFLVGPPYPLDMLTYLISILPANHTCPSRVFRDAKDRGRQSLPDETLCDEPGSRRQKASRASASSMAAHAVGSPAYLHGAGSVNSQREAPTDGRTMGQKAIVAP